MAPADAPADFNEYLRQLVPRAIPLMVAWELTHRCNQNCLLCFQGRLRPGAGQPEPLAPWPRVLDQLVDVGALVLVLTGGEPLLHPDFDEILVAARRQRFVIRLKSNGLLIDDERARQLADLAVTQVDISYFGRAEIHDRIVGRPGAHAQVHRAIAALLKAGVRAELRMPVVRENLHEAVPAWREAKKLGAGFLCDPTIAPGEGGDTAPQEHRLDPEELREFYREVRDAAGATTPPPVPESLDRPGDIPPCNGGHTTLAVMPDGAVCPCIGDRVTWGNLVEQDLSEIWNSPAAREYRALRFEDVRVCPTCELRTWCMRCPGIARREDGDLRGPSRAACLQAEAFRDVSRETR